LRVAVSLLIALLWTIPLGVAIGTNRRLATVLQPIVQITDLLRLSSPDRWRTLILPALFPYIITGAITASGGAWNASIVAEHVEFGQQTYMTTGIGAIIAQATGAGNYAMLLAGTLALVATVVFINRTFWRRLYQLAEERYRLE
jgi:NitT/TauT family transport system permease protein